MILHHLVEAIICGNQMAANIRRAVLPIADILKCSDRQRNDLTSPVCIMERHTSLGICHRINALAFGQIDGEIDNTLIDIVKIAIDLCGTVWCAGAGSPCARCYIYDRHWLAEPSCLP